jgi:hypothetical protein
MKKIYGFCLLVSFVFGLTACTPRGSSDLIVESGGTVPAAMGVPAAVDIQDPAVQTLIANAVNSGVANAMATMNAVPTMTMPLPLFTSTMMPVVAVTPLPQPTILATVQQQVVEAKIPANAEGHFTGYPFYDNYMDPIGDGNKGVATRKYVLYFDAEASNAVIRRLWVDDSLLKAEYHPAGGDPINITDLFLMGMVKKGVGTGYPDLNVIMKARGVNVTDGEALPQNSNAVGLKDVLPGSYIIFDVKDIQGVNVGMGIVIDSVVDARTIFIP